MRACFLGQNVCALGFGVALVQTKPAGDPGTQAQPPESGPEAGTVPFLDDLPLENFMARDLKRHSGRIV